MTSNAQLGSLSARLLAALGLILALGGCAKLEPRDHGGGGDADQAMEITEPDVPDLDMADDTDQIEVVDPCAEIVNACETPGDLLCRGDDSVRCVLDGNGCAVEVAESCAEGCDEPSGECVVLDPCAQVPPCTFDDCVGDEMLRRCFVDENGCNTEETVDCAAIGGTCEFGLEGGGTGPNVFCATGCPMPPDCDSPDRVCSSDSVLYTCTFDASGCLVENFVNCTGQTSCRTENGITGCLPACVQDTRCDGKAELESWCREDTVETCSDVDADGCLELIVTECGGTTMCDDTGAAPTCAITPEVTFGTNTLFEGASTFVPYMDGAPYPVTQGFQGTWMFVLAMRTRGALSGYLSLHAEATIDGGTPTTLDMVRLQVADGGDGYLYLTDIFFDLGVFEPPMEGLPITFVLHIEDELGSVFDQTFTGTVGPQLGF